MRCHFLQLSFLKAFKVQTNPLGLLTALSPDGPSKDADEAWQDPRNPQRFNLTRNNFGEAFFILQEVSRPIIDRKISTK
jgi:hypothetical protein